MADLSVHWSEHSKAMFGNSKMLAIMLAIADHDGDHFTTPELVVATGIDTSILHDVLARLTTAGIIERVGRVPGERTLLFRRHESPYWPFIFRLVEDGPTGK